MSKHANIQNRNVVTRLDGRVRHRLDEIRVQSNAQTPLRTEYPGDPAPLPEDVAEARRHRMELQRADDRIRTAFWIIGAFCVAMVLVAAAIAYRLQLWGLAI